MMSARIPFFLVVLGALALADDYNVILRGKVTMADGGPPPKSVAIMRICSDTGSAPGPLTDKKGEYTWNMPVDPTRTRVCRLETSLPGYVSSSVDISSLNGFVNKIQSLPPIVLTPGAGDPYTITTSSKDLPSKAAASWKEALKAVDAGNLQQARAQMETTVKAAPKFASGWHALGIIYEQLDLRPESRDAWEHAIQADPKLMAPYVVLAHSCVRAKDWACAAKASDGLLKIDLKHVYPVIYLDQAAARYGMKDLDGAEASAREALKLDAAHKLARAEYVLGRVLEAKGDLAGAREHMTAYIAQQTNAADIDLVKGHLQYLGKPEASSVDPDLVP
jgi:hypothetical protein